MNLVPAQALQTTQAFPIFLRSESSFSRFAEPGPATIERNYFSQNGLVGLPDQHETRHFLVSPRVDPAGIQLRPARGCRFEAAAQHCLHSHR